MGCDEAVFSTYRAFWIPALAVMMGELVVSVATDVSGSSENNPRPTPVGATLVVARPGCQPHFHPLAWTSQGHGYSRQSPDFDP